jgi:hypothetical protein
LQEKKPRPVLEIAAENGVCVVYKRGFCRNILLAVKEITMNTEAEMLMPGTEQAATPSADFIHAISRFLDTNPDDLLLELGYYSSDENLPVSGE